MKFSPRCFFLALLAVMLAAPLLRAQSAPAANAPDPLLPRVRHQVGAFLDLFSDVKCTEQVTQEKLTPKGKVEYQEQSKFDYLVIAQGAGPDISLEESRLEEQTPEHKKDLPLLVTNGFATLLLVFHPAYQDSFEFSAPEEDASGAQKLVKIRFRHIPNTRSTAVLVLRGREYPLDLMGTAWVEPETGAIVRMQAELASSMDDIGLHAFNSDVTYAPVHFKDMQDAPLLPSEATIEVETARQHWRNVHSFTGYQRFSVSTQESVRAQK